MVVKTKREVRHELAYLILSETKRNDKNPLETELATLLAILHHSHLLDVLKCLSMILQL